MLKISIADNGKGFGYELKPLGNGLGNMEKRMQLINGSFNIESSPGGTIVKLGVSL